MVRVEVETHLLRWARERAQLSLDVLHARFPKIHQWEAGEIKPTLKQLEAFANATHAPIGYFFLPEPPVENLPIPDFRTMAGREIVRPSPDLLEMIYACQDRQDWFRDYAIAVGEEPLAFIGSASIQDSVVEIAQAISATLKFSLDERATCRTWEEALRMFISKADGAGVLVMSSGIVMNNTHRKLNPEEFRGFALSDSISPLIFINGADSKSAQMFTLAHELAHLWLGQSALSDSTVASQNQNDVETWCNRVAAELLVPLDVMRAKIDPGEEINRAVQRLTRIFKVSSLVILQRLRDAGRLNWHEFRNEYDAEIRRLAEIKKASGGGDFYITTTARFSKRFAKALIGSTLEGRTLYRDAYRLLGISKPETFHELGRTLKFES